MNRICRYLPLLFAISFAYAQSAAEVNIGFGTVHDKASGSGFDSNDNPCTPSTASSCVLTPALSGFYMGFGGAIMLTKHAGFGGEITLQPAKQDYSSLHDASGNVYPLRLRQMFYDVDAIYAPVNEKKFMLRLMGGVGAASSRLPARRRHRRRRRVASTSKHKRCRWNHRRWNNPSSQAEE